MRLLDTSAAIALVLPGHPHHEETLDSLDELPCGLTGHAAFETYSVLTRLPGPDRLSPQDASELLRVTFPHTRHLSGEAGERLLASLAQKRIAGGAVYDALVAAAAVEHATPLVTRDRRAADTYRAIGADVILL